MKPGTQAYQGYFQVCVNYGPRGLYFGAIFYLE